MSLPREQLKPTASAQLDVVLRILWRGVLLTIAGCMTSVAIAVAACNVPRRPGAPFQVQGSRCGLPPAVRWSVNYHNKTPLYRELGLLYQGRANTESEWDKQLLKEIWATECGSALQRTAPEKPRIASWDVRMCGWPRPALAAVSCRGFAGDGARVDRSMTVLSNESNSLRTVVPTVPLWKGLAIDTAFFGGVLALPMLIVGPLRAARRRRRGLCPKCAYDLSGAVALGCPECGWGRV